MGAGRGSDSLSNVAKEDLAALKSIVSKHGWKIIDWHSHGQPPHPDVVSAELHGPGNGLGGVVTGVAALKAIRELRILIRGIPVPDIYSVHADLRLGGPDTAPIG